MANEAPHMKTQHWFSLLIAHALNKPELKNSHGYCFGFSVLAAQELATNQTEQLEQLLIKMKLTAAKAGWLPLSKQSIKALALKIKTTPDNESSFLQGVKCIQHPEVSSASNTPSLPIHQYELTNLFSIATTESKNQGGLTFLAPFTGTYTKLHLIKYLSSLKQTLNQHKELAPHPFTMVLRSNDHAVTLGYDTKCNEWLLINIDQLNTKQIQRFTRCKDIAAILCESFYETDSCVFSTSIFTTQVYKQKIENLTNHWKATQAFTALHSVTPGNVNLIDSNHASWLLLAILHNNVNEVSNLLMHGANVYERRKSDQVTPLFIASLLGNKDIITLLLNYGADPEACRPEDSITPLMAAAHQGYTDIVNLLLQAGADPNKLAKGGMTALKLAQAMKRDGAILALTSYSASIKSINQPIHRFFSSSRAATTTTAPDNSTHTTSHLHHSV